jgi:hypothetical protein
MPHLVAFVTFLILPVICIISVGVMAFSITIVASATASTAFLGKGGAFRLCHLGDHSLAILVQQMQRLLTILGIAIVSCGKVILKIHLEISMLYRFVTGKQTRRTVPWHRLSQVSVPPLPGPQKTWCMILEPRSPRVPCAVGLRQLLH